MQNVIDTSVLLSFSTKVFQSFPDEDIILPLVVVQELETKRHHPELGYTARQVLRFLDNLSDEGSLADGVLQEDNSVVYVHLNDVYCADLPDALKNNPSNDTRILSVAKNMGASLYTNDIPLRVLASSVGVEAKRFSRDATVIISENDKNILDIYMDTEDVNDLYADGDIDADQNFPINTNLIVHDASNPNHTVLAVSQPGWELKKVEDFELQPAGGSKTISAKNAQQKFYLDHLLNDKVKVVSAGGTSGSGKTLLALAAGEAQVRDGKFNKVLVLKGAYSVLGGDMGFLPGDMDEKFAGYTYSVFDAAEVYSRKVDIEQRIKYGKLEVGPLTFLRGRTLNNTFVILDEGQNLERQTIATVLTRLGKNSKLAITHDIQQRDNLSITKDSGIKEVINRLSGNKLFAHVEMKASLRSEIADVAYKLLD